MARPIVEITGKRFGRLVVIKLDRLEKRSSFWLCKCDCGSDHVVDGRNLKRGTTQSCGCLQSESISNRVKTHGLSKTKDYKLWQCMINRCHNERSEKFKYYGGAGINVCERWRDYENFIEDMGPRPVGMQIDRKDNNKGYEPGNCRWATPKEQQRNRRNNRRVVAFGRSMTLAELAEIVGINSDTIGSRLDRGWCLERALSKQIRSTP